jgi:hypothetical protein
MVLFMIFSDRFALEDEADRPEVTSGTQMDRRMSDGFALALKRAGGTPQMCLCHRTF